MIRNEAVKSLQSAVGELLWGPKQAASRRTPQRLLPDLERDERAGVAVARADRSATLPRVEVARPRTSQPSMMGYLFYAMGLITFVAGSSLFIAVLSGFRRPLREMGIPTPLGTGIILLVVGAFVAWSGTKSAHEGHQRRRRTPPRVGATAVHVMFDGDARPPGLEDGIREQLEERFAGAKGVIVVDLYYRSQEGFLITRAEMSDTEMSALSDTLPLDEESYVESYLDRTRAHLEAIGIRALN